MQIVLKNDTECITNKGRMIKCIIFKLCSSKDIIGEENTSQKFGKYISIHISKDLQVV